MTFNHYLKYEKERSLDCAQKIYSGYLINAKYKTAQGILDNLKDDHEKNKFLKTSFFYFHRGWNIANKSGWQEEFDEGFIFIVLIAVIETIMSQTEHLNFGEWVKRNNKNKTDDAGILWEEYSAIFGINKKVKDFFEKYIDEDDKDVFLSCFLHWDRAENKMVKYNNLSKIANLFYSLRSEYVHCSEIIPVRENVTGYFSFKGVDHSCRMDFKKIREILEASFFNYFLDKAGESKIVEVK